MRKFIICVFILIMLLCCSAVNNWTERTPASWGEYEIDTVTNEVGLKRLYPDLAHSDCGLADDDFKKYVRKRIDHRRPFQFVVFIEGTTMIGKRCYKRALIFYLRKR